MGYYLSLDEDLNPADDVLLSPTLTIGAIAAGQTIPPLGLFETQVQLPGEPPPGFEFATTVYVGPYVDDTFVVQESDETNNDASVPLAIQYPNKNPRLVWFRLVEDTGISSSDLYTSKSPTEGRIANLQPNTTVRYEYYNRDSRQREMGTVTPDSTGYFLIPVQLSTYDPISDPIEVTARLYKGSQAVQGAIRTLSFSLDTIVPSVIAWDPVSGTLLHRALNSARATIDEDGYAYGADLGSPPTAGVSGRTVSFTFSPPLENGTHTICVGPDVGDLAGNRIVPSCTIVEIFVPHYDVSIGDVSVLEPNGPAVFTVTVTPPVIPGDVVRVSYVTENRTAKAGQDYSTRSGTLEFLPGESQKTISVPILDDTIPEPLEWFLVNRTSVWSEYGSLSGRWWAEGTIIDDDCFAITIERDVTVPESAGIARFDVLVWPAPGPNRLVQVEVSPADGTATHNGDYLEEFEYMVFWPGEQHHWFDVIINEDNLVEPDETFYVSLSNARGFQQGAPICVDTIDGQAVGTITDNDIFYVYLVDDVEVLEGETAEFEVRVEPTPSAGQQVIVDFFTTDGSATVEQPDYYGVWTSLIFDPGESSSFVPVTTEDDEVLESIENFFANLDNARATVDGEPRDVIITRPTVVGWIVDDEVPPDYVVTLGSCNDPPEPYGPAFVSVQVSPAVISGDLLRVGYFTQDGTAKAGPDYVSRNGVLEFNPGESAKTISIPIVNDLIPLLTEYFKVYLSSASASLGGGVTIQNRETRCTIYDDDMFHVSIGPDVTIPESQSPANFSVTVTPTPSVGQIVYVNVFTSDGTATGGLDYLPVFQTLTFGPGVGSRSVSVPILDDLLVEPNETFFVSLNNPKAFMAGQPLPATLDRGQAKGTILDDDYTVTVNDVILRESDCNGAAFVVRRGQFILRPHQHRE